MPHIYFSLQEANELIQKIKPLVSRIKQLSEELELLDNTKLEFDNDSIENLMLEVELNRSFHEKSLEMYTLIGKLIKEGCIIRNLDTMEIDFYSRFNMREIAFCWKEGEEKIQYWHLLGQDCDKRQTINIIERNYFDILKKMK